MDRKIITLTAAFFISFAVGFGITKVVKPSKSAGDDPSNKYSPVVSESNSGENKPKKQETDSLKGEGATIDNNENEVVVPVAEPETPMIEKMSKARFQTLLLNHKDVSLFGGNNPGVAKSIVFTFRNIHEGEKRPDDVLAIRDKISYGTWSSLRVLSVGYDTNNRINSAEIEPIYTKEPTVIEPIYLEEPKS